VYSYKEKSWSEKYQQSFVLMLVKRVEIHQNEDKTLDLCFEFNGGFEDSYGVEIEDDV